MNRVNAFYYSGRVIYRRFFNRDDLTVWNGASMVAWVDGNVPNYAVVLSEIEMSGMYSAVVPGLPGTVGGPIAYDSIAVERIGAIAALTDPIIAGSAITFEWSGTAIVTGGDIIVTPLQANAQNPRYSANDAAPLAQHSAPTDIKTFRDSNGALLQFTGKTVRLVFASVTDLGEQDVLTDDTLAGSFKYESPSNGITIGGTNDTQITLLHDATKLSTAGSYRYFWWNVTDKLLLERGTVDIEPTIFDV